MQSDVVTSLYTKALHELRPDLIDEFVEKFCLLKLSITNDKKTSSKQETKADSQIFAIKTQ